MRYLRRVYDWVLSWAHTPYALPALVVLAFCESSFFPVPPDVLLIPLVLGATTNFWKYALAATLASTLGGIAGYGIGYFAWQTIGRWLLAHVMGIDIVLVAGREDVLLPSYFGALLGTEPVYLFQTFDTYNAWIVFVFGLSPLPYKLITISAGFAQLNLSIFTAASFFSRGLRFFIVAFLLYKWGEAAKVFIDKHFNLLALVFAWALVLGFGLILYFL